MSVAQLNDLCTKITKGTTPTSIGMSFEDSGVPFIRVNNFGSRSLEFEENTLFISGETHQKLKRSCILGGDVLLSIAGTIGKSCIVPVDAPELNCNQAVCLIRPIENKLLNNYLQHWLESDYAHKQYSGKKVTGVISNLSLTMVRNLQIPLPPLPEQKRIATILDAADALRSKRRQSIAELDTLLQATFLDMFGDPVTNPKGWDESTLKSSFNFKTGKLDSNAAVEGGKYPFFTCSRETYEINDYAFDCEALLLAGNNANADYSVKHYKGKFNAYQRTYVITVQEETLTYEYAKFALEYLLVDLKRFSKGSNTKYLTMTILNRMPILLPSVELQREFAVIVERIEAQKARMQAHLQELDTLFAALQQRAFNGEL